MDEGRKKVENNACLVDVYMCDITVTLRAFSVAGRITTAPSHELDSNERINWLKNSAHFKRTVRTVSLAHQDYSNSSFELN